MSRHLPTLAQKLSIVWSDERWHQRQMIAERKLSKSDVRRVVEEHKAIAREYERVSV